MLCSFELHLYFTEITTIDVRECKNHMKLKDKAPVVYWELFWIQPGASIREQQLVYMSAGVGHIISKCNLTGKFYESYFHIPRNIALSYVY